MQDINEMRIYSAGDIAKILDISTNVARDFLDEASRHNLFSVVKVGVQYRVNANQFDEWNTYAKLHDVCNGGDNETVEEDPENDIDMDDTDITDIDGIENYDVDADELDYDTVSPDAEDTEVVDSEHDIADVQEPESDSAMDSEDVELEDTDIPGEDNLPDDFDPDAEVDVEADVESIPEEVMDFDNVPDAQDFENMINSDVQDMADYASQYEGSKEDIGDLEDYGDMDVDIDADLGDVDVVEEPIEPEANFEADIDVSEIAEMAEGAEEAIELIATIL